MRAKGCLLAQWVDHQLMELRKIGPNGVWASALWEIKDLPGSRIYKSFKGGWRINFRGDSLSELEFPTRRAALEALEKGDLSTPLNKSSLLSEILAG